MQQAIAVGIDIGKTHIHVSAYTPGEPPPNWPVRIFSFKDDLNWHNELVQMLAPRAFVAIEPTGYHLSAPIVNIITTMSDAIVWLVGHSITGKFRDAHVSAAKTDEMDARALALIAYRIRYGEPPRNCRPYNRDLDQEVQRLRSLVNARERTMKTSTQVTNRLHAFAHSIHPLCDIRFKTWVALAHQDVITAADIKAHVEQLPADRDRRKSRPIEMLAHDLPNLEAPAVAVDNVKMAIRQIMAVDDERQRVEAAIIELCNQEPFVTVTSRLLTMPNIVNELNIAPFHVACHGLLDVMTPDQVKSAIGISAKTDTSGSQNKTRAKKGGYPPAQKTLYTWTMTLVRPNAPDNPIRDYYHRLKAREDKKKEFRATRAKLAMLISGVARSPEGYQYEGKGRS